MIKNEAIDDVIAIQAFSRRYDETCVSGIEVETPPWNSKHGVNFKSLQTRVEMSHKLHTGIKQNRKQFSFEWCHL